MLKHVYDIVTCPYQKVSTHSIRLINLVWVNPLSNNQLMIVKLILLGVDFDYFCVIPIKEIQKFDLL